MCNHDFRDDMCVTCLEEALAKKEGWHPPDCDAFAWKEVARLEGLILEWAFTATHPIVLMAEAKRIRAKREECRVCATKAVGLPTPGYTHDESCAQREAKK